MKLVPLSNSPKCAIVDDEDYENISQYPWRLNDGGYVVRKPGKHTIRMHRVIINTPKRKFTDHINGNKLDNRRTNLRPCTLAQNQWNRPGKQGASTFKGVCWFKRDNKWLANINFKGKRLHIGYFETERHAALAYDLWARLLHKEFAQTNFSSI